MNRIFRPIYRVALLVFVGFLAGSCDKQDGEVGTNSLYYVFNGTEPGRMACPREFLDQTSEARFQYDHRRLRFHLCISTPKDYPGKPYMDLVFDIRHFYGPGTYYFDATSGNLCQLEGLPVSDDRRTYLKILEFSGDREMVSALFECYFPAQNNSPEIQLTKGRFFLHFSAF